MGPRSVWASQPHQEKLWGRRVPPTWTPGTQARPGEAQPSYRPTGSLTPPPVSLLQALTGVSCPGAASGGQEARVPGRCPNHLSFLSVAHWGWARSSLGREEQGEAPGFWCPKWGRWGPVPWFHPLAPLWLQSRQLGPPPTPPEPSHCPTQGWPHIQPKAGWTQAGPSPAPAHLISPETSQAPQNTAVRL